MEHIHEVSEELAEQQIEAEADYAAEVLAEAAAELQQPDQTERALRQFFGIPSTHESAADDPKPAKLERAKLFIEGLRKLADLYLAHPELELPEYFSPFTIFNVRKADLPKVARIFGSLEKRYDESSFRLRKDFGGGIILETYSSRESVCQRVKIGERVVPAHVVPAKPAEPELIVEEKTVDEYAWECPGDSLLAPPAGDRLGENTQAAEVGEVGESLPPEPIRSDDD